jgi:hypothetical protein
MDYGLPHPTARPDEEKIVGRAYHILATGDFYPGEFAYSGLLKYLNTLALAVYFVFGKLIGRYDRLWDFLFDVAVFRPGLHYQISRVVSVIFGVATIGATYFLGLEAYRRRAIGIIAAGAVATCFLHVRDSRFATVDVAMTFFVTLSLLFSVRVAGHHRTRDFVMAGLFAGLATATKYNGGAVIVGLFLACLPPLMDRKQPMMSPARRIIIGRLALSVAFMVAAFALASPYSLIHLSQVLAAVRGHTELLYGATGPIALWTHLGVTFPQGFGWPFFLASTAGVLRAAWLRRPPDWVLLSFLVVTFASVAGARWIFPRYVIPFIPLLAVLAAELGYSVFVRTKPVPAIILCLVLAGPGLRKSIEFDRVAARKDTRVLAAEWVADNLPARSEILLCRGYGAPVINTDPRRPPIFAPREINCNVKEVKASETSFLVTHEHPYLHSYSRISDPLRQFLTRNARSLATFDPFAEREQGEPYFYPSDAFYLPISDLHVMERGGPILTIWELQ